ncbi:MAG TPA: hypothetical protein VG167_18980 [Verrucomicrobiae bacterium]|nr:hypothetical protein [Verrucomicrobiae bacterium]
MKRFSLSLILLALALAPAAQAYNIINATITITNQAGTTNGQTLTVNGDTRTWTNSVSLPPSQVLTNNSIIGCATNLFNAVSDSPFANLFLAMSGTNGIVLQTAPNGTLTVTLSAGWGAVAYTTNVLTSAIALRLPITVEAAGQQTNLASMLALALDLSTNALSATDTLLGNYCSLSQAQTLSGTKTFTGQVVATNVGNVFSGTLTNVASLQGTASYLTGGLYKAATLLNSTQTNSTCYGGFASLGAIVPSEQIGQSAWAGGANATAIGDFTVANGNQSTAVGYSAHAVLPSDTALGTGSFATGGSSTAIGLSSYAGATNSTALGVNASSPYTNSTAVGANCTNTAPNQVMLGGPGSSAVVPNSLQVGGGATFGGGVTNLWTAGTNTFLPNSDIAFTRYALGSLANGNNAGVAVGTNVFVEVSGPTGAFTINGINGQPNRDGKFLILLNRTGQNMTIANDSGVEPTAANRIYCLTGADKTVTGNSAAMLIYSGTVSHWVVLSFAQ